ncbi:MAG: M28 family peptidase [Bacteroidota bacterium]
MLVIVCFTLTTKINAQSNQHSADSAFIRSIYNQTLSDGSSYAWLEHLTQRIGNRLSGSENAEKAVRWTKSMLDTLGLDTVWLQPIMVPHWVRGAAEQVRIKGTKSRAQINLHALALGGSVATPIAGIQAPVVEVKTWAELDKLGEAGIKGKIVFFNRPMDPTKIRTFEAYGGAVDQRVGGASKAARYGAVGVLVRSMTLKLDDVPHTGTLIYDSAYAKIPAVAISTKDAEKLSKLLRTERDARVYMKLNCKTLPDAPSFNVIGEIRGSERPNDYIIVGGHLDSWDVGQGAHDDGTGIVQSMEVIRTMKRLGYRPKHSLRCVLFMNEENGGRGGDMYAKESKRKGEFPLAAIESDAGGFTPRGFGFEGDPAVFGKFFEKVMGQESLLAPYGLNFSKGGSGSDVGHLRDQKGLLIGYSPDSQRYFDIHHTAADVFSAVNKRELELGAASMSALVYLLDKYGL